jgi:hypothetical protein
MRMLVAALIGGVVLGFVGPKIVTPQVAGMVTDAGTQGMISAGVVAFLASLWGWVGKGLIGGKPKE